MRNRAAVIISENNRLALIKRMRKGQTYYVFPGGGIEADETPAEAAKREAMEELGLEVEIGECIFKLSGTAEESYFLAAATGGKFGTGTGLEFTEPESERGSYEAVWIARDKLTTIKLYPEELAAKLSQNLK
ncbi:NUDIX domain-containing protein [Planococcus halotolerans]|uniref:DNA mismatch repair protein MutT n=1 Tax=Planococcus halotolerans TaxID=2233542 RepID=A0A365L0J5_9BACL|nr:NUDIX domain-containing protein [Planococcus halotolerans]QHJ71295.1 NUDIX domain-containing protein [Planococcus halotolerans]RAZ78944.1 DNA mismatch repair protein MutT [Planococcus halotolerans]